VSFSGNLNDLVLIAGRKEDLTHCSSNVAFQLKVILSLA